MAKMRVFELARELNIPGKDLIKRIQAMGTHVEGNFNVLDEATVKMIKAKMLEPVTRVEQEAAPVEEAMPGEPARKRRIISAKRSQEVHRIQESLGVTGPLPGDVETRAEVHAEPPPPPAAVAAAAPGGEVVAEPVAEPEAPPALAAAPAAVAAPEQPPSIPGMPPRGTATAAFAAAEAAKLEAARAEKKKPKLAGAPEAADEAESPARTKWKELRKPGKAPGVPEVADVQWRDFKKVDHKQASDLDDWVRQPRRRSAHARRMRDFREAEQKHTFEPRKKAIRIAPMISVGELAGLIGVKANDIIRKLVSLGVMATINQTIEGATAELIATEFNVQVELDTRDLEDLVREEVSEPERLAARPPIVTIMGHVDHGKTTLLDYIRRTKIAAGEAGGITQHIGAYYVPATSGDVVFLDTPGHEAFTTLRARGADITDLVVLVVAADDGVMPQTVEAIEHARAAKVPIMVCINKIDRPNADPEKIKRQLMEFQLLPEEYGGDTVIVPVSAKTGQGVEQLLELIHLQAELLELKAVCDGKARGYVIESTMDRRRGAVASVIVQRGTLRIGDDFVAGHTFGRVRAMFDDTGAPVLEATPSMPVEVLGYTELPAAGDIFVVMENDHIARQVAEMRANKQRREGEAVQRRVSLEDFLKGVAKNEVGLLNLVLKADTQGSLEAIRTSLEKQGTDQVRVAIIRAGIGGITETDISLAVTTRAVVIGFNVRAEAKAAMLAQQEGVDVKTYTIIYELIDDVRKGLEGLLKPLVREEVIGRCEVRKVFSVPRDGQIIGGYVTEGRLERNTPLRVYRDNVLIHTGAVNSLRRFKEDVSSVSAGYECGLRIANYSDVKEGDLLEAFTRVEEAQTLQRA